jgi:anaerobic ribonucleoside-triphosphate reductase activating protein
MRPQFLQPSLDLLQIPAGYLNLMDYANGSEVNGPGCRAVVWLQGCLRQCPQCFNPASCSFEINQLVAVESLAQRILSYPGHTGVTFSGGEPFWQAPALAKLARLVKAGGLNVMAITGFTLEQLQDPYGPAGAANLLQELDYLVEGACH